VGMREDSMLPTLVSFLQSAHPDPNGISQQPGPF
jgi:hypothetical protein